MAWEVYTRQIIRTGDPVVTITKMGRLAVNMIGTSIFESQKASHVVLLWDRDACKCAIKIANSKDSGAYKLTYNPKSNGSGFSAVTFFNYIRYDWTATRAFNAAWDDEGKMLIFDIPKEHIGKPVPEGYLSSRGSIKRGDRVNLEAAGRGESESAHQGTNGVEK
ncbi:MAG: hypothetical protein ACLQVL_35100 [Terriglobia bacterium]